MYIIIIIKEFVLKVTNQCENVVLNNTRYLYKNMCVIKFKINCLCFYTIFKDIGYRFSVIKILLKIR